MKMSKHILNPERIIGKPTRYQKRKITKGKLLNQRFKFKKDVFEEEAIDQQLRIITPDELQEALEVADKINIFTSGNTIELPDGLREAVKQEWIDADREERIIISVEEPTEEGKLAVRALTEDERRENDYMVCHNPNEVIRSTLMNRYNDLVIELAMMVADRIKTFKKRNAIMTKLTGEDYGFIEESSWTTGETTTFKYWPASWRFERLIGTSIIFEARFHHTTFELLSYCTVFAPDAKTVITRNGHEYSLDNVDDLQGIIAIYEKAIDFVNRKARR